ncbi:hypothetical protein H4V99_000688 [Cryobacterium sp. CG_9.6]|nr:hypothetical protein [Cryobacterium sp. CG_9.6]
MSVAGMDVDGQNVSASGYVSGLIEDGGTCSFVFSGADRDATRTSRGITNASTTSCGLIQIPANLFMRGAVELVLTYSSDSVTVSSQPMILEIP